MKYDKKDFTVLPNKHKRLGLSPNLQTVYTWLCEHSDENMRSFPSRKTLAFECGMSVRTLDRSIQELVSLGMIAKSARHNDSEQTTNMYEVVLFTRGGDKSALGSDKSAPRGRQKQHTELNPFNSTHLTKSTNVDSSGSNEPDRTDLKKLFYELVEALGFDGSRVVYTEARRKKLKARLKTFGEQAVREAAQNVADDEFLQGDNDSGKRYGDIDFLLRSDENLEKRLNRDKKPVFTGDWK